jgi:hypothetical protein
MYWVRPSGSPSLWSFLTDGILRQGTLGAPPTIGQDRLDFEFCPCGAKKGLIRGLTRCPNPLTMILTYYPFWMDVGESVRCLSVEHAACTRPRTDECGVGGSALEGGVLPYSVLS